MTAISQALTRALVDFVWQGLLAAFLLWIALYLLRGRSARARYAASCVTLAMMATLPVLTAYLAYDPVAKAQPAGAWIAAPRAIHATAAASPGFTTSLSNWLAHWAVPIWAAGVLLFSLRLVWASRQISVLRRRSHPAEDAVLGIVTKLRERMLISRPVRVLISAAADCPSVVGWLKPVVLLPAAALLDLTPQQLEAVLAHELAHIRRYDYLVNLLQTVVETLLFYHPAVWWVSARIRQERELCCDDLAVEVCGDALCYARALTRLERLRLASPMLVLGSSGGSLLERIQRLAGQAGAHRGPAKLPGILALSLGLICLASNVQWAHGQQHDAPTAEPVAVDLGGAHVIHREDVKYPAAAIDKGVQGTVVVETTLDGNGEVSDARVLTGPAELRKAALESVLQWHFTHDAAGTTRQVSITFDLAAQKTRAEGSHDDEDRALADAKRERDEVEARVQKLIDERMAAARNLEYGESAERYAQIQREHALESEMMAQAYAKDAAEMQSRLQVQSGDWEQAAKDYADRAATLERRLEQGQRAFSEEKMQSLAKMLQDNQSALTNATQLADLEKRLAEMQGQLSGSMFAGRRLKTIDIRGLDSAARQELLAKLPVHIGDTLSEDTIDKVSAALKQFDQHLSLAMGTTHDGQVEIRIGKGSVYYFSPSR